MGGTEMGGAAMRTALALTAGFSLPTAGFVVGRHLGREASVGAALDGTLTSIWFAGWFLAGALGIAGAARLAARTAPAPPSPPARRAFPGPATFGLLAGVVVWAALLFLWTLEPMDPLRERALAINSAAMAASGILGALAAAARRRAH